MEYVEFLRVRRVITVFALFVAAVTLVVIADTVIARIRGGSHRSQSRRKS